MGTVAEGYPRDGLLLEEDHRDATQHRADSAGLVLVRRRTGRRSQTGGAQVFRGEFEAFAPQVSVPTVGGHRPLSAGHRRPINS